MTDKPTGNDDFDFLCFSLNTFVCRLFGFVENKVAYLDAFEETVAVFGWFFNGLSLRLALNINASLLQVSSISNFRSNFRRFALSGSSKSRTEWLIGCCNDDVDGNTSSHNGGSICGGGVDVTVAANWLLMPLDDALAFT